MGNLILDTFRQIFIFDPSQNMYLYPITLNPLLNQYDQCHCVFESYEKFMEQIWLDDYIKSDDGFTDTDTDEDSDVLYSSDTDCFD